MKKGLTEIIYVLDGSGSMESMREAVVFGFNKFVSDQKQGKGDARLTLVQFSDYDKIQTLFDNINIQVIPVWTMRDYLPEGNTALYDAVGKTIDVVGSRLSVTPEDQRPEKVLFVIYTDGMENNSRFYTKQDVNEKTAHQLEVYSWEFIYLGSNQDSCENARGLGINNYANVAYVASSIENSYATLSKAVSELRSTGFISQLDPDIK